MPVRHSHQMHNLFEGTHPIGVLDNKMRLIFINRIRKKERKKVIVKICVEKNKIKLN